MGLIVGTISLAIVGAFLNYFLLLPVYSKIYGAPIQAFIDMGNVLNPAITDLKTFVMYAVVPFNIFKGIVVSAMVILIYKRLSPILHK